MERRIRTIRHRQWLTVSRDPSDDHGRMAFLPALLAHLDPERVGLQTDWMAPRCLHLWYELEPLLVYSSSLILNEQAYHGIPGTHNGANGTRPPKTCSANYPFDNDWAELARSKPTMFLTTLLVSLASLPPLHPTSALTVEEAFKSHLVSLSPSPTQSHHIPSLYSILTTFWLPSSPAYFSLTASTSTARTPSDHRFLYWDPQPLVFNGISCPNCSAPLLNQGRIKSGPIKVYDIERPFFIIGCEYVCKSTICTNANNGEPRKYASSDPSILRSLPTKLKDEFPARLISESDSGTGAEVWNWQALGVSKLLWNLVRGALKAGLQKEGIIDLLYNVQRGLPGEDDKKGEEHEESNHQGSTVNGNGQPSGSYARPVQQSSGVRLPYPGLLTNTDNSISGLSRCLQ